MTSEHERNDSDTGVRWIIGGIVVFVIILVVLG